MYNYLKQFLKRFISKKALFKYEPILRGIYYQFYRGADFQCNICGKKLRAFISPGGKDKICPNCGSSSRSRRLWKLLESEFLKVNTAILDFSPSRSIYRKMKDNPSISYTSTDRSDDFLADKKWDITNIDARDESCDLAVCYHILEHIEDDIQATKELYRVLKEKGACIIQTPFKEGEIYEDSSTTTDEGRVKHFGQKDHVRIYSAKGLKERLSNCGFRVEIREYKEEIDNRNGFLEKETILICTK
jgi:predicted SAM-dependent methyltransferase